MEKENLDNLFRESLDEFRQAPDPKVWERIQASLDKKAGRRRRVVPLWWQLGGAAAALALILFLLVPGAEEGSLSPEDPISNVPPMAAPIEESNEGDENGIEPSEDALVIQRSEENTSSDSPIEKSEQNNTSNTAVVAISNSSEDRIPATETAQNDEQARSPVTQSREDSEGIAAHTEETNINEGDDATVERMPRGEPTNPVAEEVPSTDLAEIEEKQALEELIALPEEEPFRESDATQGKWAIGPSIAPVYFNGLGDGSPIDQAFVSNEKSGSFNMSYGLQVSYQVNRRLQIRSGMHKVDFGYNTNDIVFSSSLQTSSATQMKNVDYSPAAEYLVVGNQTTAPAKPTAGFRNEVAARNTSREGTMVQEFGYLEVPLELNYTVIDRKLGLHLISGISSMFLVDNMVSLESDSGTTEVGQANNLNDVNFSANFGFGMQYRVSDKIRLQVEPLLKYQLNTFSDTAGEFRPYSIGIYSGIRYKF